MREHLVHEWHEWRKTAIVTAIVCAVFAIAIYVTVHLTIDRTGTTPAPSGPPPVTQCEPPDCI